LVVANRTDTDSDSLLRALRTTEHEHTVYHSLQSAKPHLQESLDVAFMSIDVQGWQQVNYTNVRRLIVLTRWSPETRIKLREQGYEAYTTYLSYEDWFRVIQCLWD
jgi:hypothetical protein